MLVRLNGRRPLQFVRLDAGASGVSLFARAPRKAAMPAAQPARAAPAALVFRSRAMLVGDRLHHRGFEIAADFRRCGQPVVVRLRRIRRDRLSRTAVAAAPAPAPPPPPPAFALFGPCALPPGRTIVWLLGDLVLAARLNLGLARLLDRRRLVDYGREIILGERRQLDIAPRAGRRLAALDGVVVCAGQRVIGLNRDRNAE